MDKTTGHRLSSYLSTSGFSITRMLPLGLAVSLAVVGCQDGDANKLNNRSKTAGLNGKLESPANLSMSGPQSAVSGSEILIAWDQVAKAANYTLLVSLDATCARPEFQIKNILTTSQTLTISQAGAYYLCIQPYNAAGELIVVESEAFKIAVSQASANPLAASSLRGVLDPLDQSSILFTWAPGQAGLSAIRDYTLRYYDQADCTGRTDTVSKLKEPKYMLRDFALGKTYSFSIETFNEQGHSATSACSEAVVVPTALASDFTAPLAGGEGVVAANAELSSTSIMLSWSPASDGVAKASDIEYFICSGPSQAAIDTVAECLSAQTEMPWTANKTSFSIGGKSPNTTYYFNVIASDTAGNKTSYKAFSQRTLPDTTAPAPGAFAAPTAVNEFGFTLNWLAATDNATPAANIEYFVCSGASALALDSVAKCLAATQEMGWSVQTTSLALSGKLPGVSYHFNVVAKDGAGNTALYPGVTQATSADLAPPTPGAFSASTAVGQTGFTLNWTPGSDSITALANLEYYVCSAPSAAALDTLAKCLAASQELVWTANKTDLVIAGKTPASTYYYNIIVRDGAGNQALYAGKTQATANDTTPPSPGAFLASTAVGNTGFTLNWSAASDNHSVVNNLEYFVCSGASAAAIDTIAECKAATQEMTWSTQTTSLALSGKSPSTSYFYNVIVRDEASNEALYNGLTQATTADATDPTPGAFSASTAVGNTGFTLHWSAASDNISAAAALEYFVCSGANAAAIDTAAECTSSTQEMNWTAATTSLAITGKTAATTYYYNIVVRDAAGNLAAYAGQSQATTADTTAPTAGSFSASTGVGNTGFTLNWSAGSDLITSAANLQYFVCSGASAAAIDTTTECTAATQEMNWTANTTSFAVTGKAPVTTYYYNVVVRDAAGNEAIYDGRTQATTADFILPTAGTFSASTGVGNIGFTLVWSAASDNITAAASLQYFVCSGANAAAIDTAAECTAATQEMNWTANTTSLAVTGKAPSTTYYYNVVVRDAANNEALYDGKAQATTADVTIPVAGSFSAATGVGDSGFTLNWSAATDNVTAAASLEYFVCSGANAAAIDTAAECTSASQAMNWTANTTSLAVTGKTPSTTYYYNVVVRDAAGNEAVYAGRTQATNADTTAPTAGSFSASTGVGDTSFTLVWSAGSDLITSAANLQYFVCSGANAAAIDTAAECTGATQEMNWTANTTSLAITGKAPVTTYYYNVVVRDAAGNEAIYDGRTQATTADVTLPTAGTFSASTGVGNTGFTLVWSAASDNVTAAASLQYFVCSGANAAAIDTAAECKAASQEMNWTANTTSLAITGKAPSTTYYYNVVVRDGANNEALYDGKAQATTADVTLPVAGTFSASTSVGDSGFTLNWSAATDNVTAAASLEYFVCSGANAAAIDTLAECIGATQAMTWTANTTSLAITGKTPSTTYYYNVVVRDAANNQALYDGKSQATASDATPPTASTIWQSHVVTDRSFTLRWGTATDNYTAAANLQYFVCSGANAAAIDTAAECVAATQEMNWTTNASSLAITGKSASTTYYYNIVVRDAAGNQAIYPGIDETTNASVFSINSGAAYATSTNVTLNILATQASDMLVTNTAACAGGTWETYTTSKAWTLGQPENTSTVYIMFKNGSLQSPCLSDTIVHDSQAPTGAAVTVSSGDTYATSSSVTVGLAASDASQMYITNTSGCSSGGTWETYATTKSSWTLSPLNNTTTVYAKFRDAAGNETSCESDAIVHDSVIPTTPSSFSDGTTVTTSGQSPQFSWGASTESGSGLANYQVALGTTSGGTEVMTWTSIGTGTSYTITGLNLDLGTTYYGSVRALDNAGNVSSVALGDGFTYTVNWVAQAYIKTGNGDSGDNVGTALSLYNDTLAVGVSYENSSQTTITNGTTSDGDDSKSYAGAVYVYRRTGTAWAQEAFIKASNNAQNSYFGSAVTLYDDTLIVGHPSESSTATTITYGTTSPASGTNWTNGAAVVYRRSGTVWAQEAQIKAPIAGTLRYARRLEFDGTTLILGAINESSNLTTVTNGSTASTDTSRSNSGAAFVLTRSGTTWTREAHLKAPNADAGDNFGSAVTVSGNLAAVAAAKEASNQTTITNGATASTDNSYTNDGGAVYVFSRTGTNWANEAYIKPSNMADWHRFGEDVTMAGDLLVVGAMGDGGGQTTIINGTGTASGGASNSGAAFVYKRTGTSWAQEALIKPPNSLWGNDFGSGVALSGNTLVVGAKAEDSNVTTVTNGTTASTDTSNGASGAAYVFRRLSNGTWRSEAYLKAPNNGANDQMGREVAIHGNTIAVGAPNEDSNQTTVTNGTTASTDDSSADSGAVYIFTR